VGVPLGSAAGPIRLVNKVGVLVNKVGATIGNKVGTVVAGKLWKGCPKTGFGIGCNMLNLILWNYHFLSFECNSHISMLRCINSLFKTSKINEIL